MYPYEELKVVLHRDLDSHEGGHIQNVAKLFLKQSLYAKLSPGGITKLQEKRALEKFLLMNERCGYQSEFLSDRVLEMVLYLKGYMTKALTDGVGERSPFELIKGRLVVGPGSNTGVASESHYTKCFGGPLSGTNPYLLTIYQTCTSFSDTWQEAEKCRLAHCDALKVVPGNVLFYVPKNSDIARTACTEPLLNLMVQAGIGTFLSEDVLPRLGIQLRSQQFLNRTAALDASASGRFATIDLSSASDSISWRLVQDLLSGVPGVLGLIRSARSPVTVLPDGSTVELKMVSSMGNGFTFPLETLIFSCAVKAAYAVNGLPNGSGGRDFFCFGDDIVCRREAFEDCLQLLGYLGFLVNKSKTFNEGPFRESCGVDAWEGFDVRGVFIESLETDAEVHSAFNLLARWSAIHNIPLTGTLEYLLRGRRRRYVPFSEEECGGFKVPASVWNGRPGIYGRREYRPLKNIGARVNLTTYLPVDEDGQVTSGNFAGAEYSFVLGYIMSTTTGWIVPVRPHEPEKLWFPRSQFTFWWDWCPRFNPAELLTEFWWLEDRHRFVLDEVAFERWKTFVAWAVH